MKFKRSFTGSSSVNGSRRRFVQGVAAGSALLGLGLNPIGASASANPRLGPQILRGNRFDLNINHQFANFTGKKRLATAVNGSVPSPVLRWKEGERITLQVTNHLAQDSSIHWHGIILPTNMDGVPGLSFDGIKPGETYKYQFDVNQNGTYWYHSHSGFQEQEGMYGAIIIDSLEPEPFAYDRDYAVVLSDWTDENTSNVYAKLKKQSDYYNFQERTVGDLWRDVRDKGIQQTWSERSMWNEMRMSDRDISDITGYTYTYLMNGVAPADGWLGLFKRGEKIRLRFINAAAMTFFDVRIPGLKMTVVASDGQNIDPVTVDEFRIGVAETYDVIVEPHDDSAYTIFAQTIDRTGYARGTLTPDATWTAEVPEMDSHPILTHGDMGMAMGSMSGMKHDMGAMGSGMNHKMDMSKMDHNMGHMSGGMEGMKHAGHSMGPQGKARMHPEKAGQAGYGSAQEITHAQTEFGPHIDMRAESPQYRLDDPGIGLRNNGRRVLTYADICNFYRTTDRREPGREIQLHLTGNMSRYMWSINGIRFADADPLELKYGERVRITLVNDTMMNHPIHLHGVWSELETSDPDYIPRKHTIIAQPGAKISYLVTADAKGTWAYHCHLLYHMLGMFRKVVIS